MGFLAEVDGNVAGWAISVLIYLYTSYCLYTLAQKANMDNAFFAFIPFLDLIVLFSLADISFIWIIGLLVPLVNIAIFIWIWCAICQRRGKSGFLGLLIAVPVLNLVLPGYLAFFTDD